MTMSAETRFDLSGRTALVTGGSRGIGAGMAVALAEHGADVAIIYRSARAEADKVASTIRGLGRQAWVEQYDLMDTAGIPALTDRIWASTGGIDILVNNAGMAYVEHFNQITLEHWRNIFAVHVDAVFFMSQRIAEQMIAAGRKGTIINISSKNGLAAEPGLAHYNSAKGAQEMMTKSLATELGPHGITVNTIAPGVIVTDIRHEFDIDVDAFLAWYEQHIPLEGRFGTIEDCAGIAVFLASPAGGYITGQAIVNDGGVLAQQLPLLKQVFPPYKNSVAKD
jgi:NAD(P)-dependent dehydrogenase (short-subunit alcohol dehydrogenase family)